MTLVSDILRIYKTRQSMTRNGITNPSQEARNFFNQIVDTFTRLDQTLPCTLIQEPSINGEWMVFFVEGEEQARLWIPSIPL